MARGFSIIASDGTEAAWAKANSIARARHRAERRGIFIAGITRTEY
jgi:hypothetical protein